MAKDLSIPMLFDFYGQFLTEKQSDALSLYYNQDLSLGEISVHLNITRQGVRDNIKRGEKILYELEEKLQLVKKFNDIQNEINNVDECIKNIEEINNTKIFSAEITKELLYIKQILNNISDKI